jgi:hypothetical protein
MIKDICTIVISGWNTVLSSFLVLITGALAFYTYHLWKATYQLAKGAEETAKKQLRAYVSVKEITPQKVAAADRSLVDNWRINIILANGGNTPTKNLLCGINWGVFDQPLPDDFEFPDKPHSEPTIGLIGPNAVLYSEYVDIPTPLIDSHVANGHKHVYIWGWVDYNDIFDSTSRHRTEYCIKVTKRGSLLGFEPRGKFNGADEECLRRPTPYKDE